MYSIDIHTLDIYILFNNTGFFRELTDDKAKIAPTIVFQQNNSQKVS